VSGANAANVLLTDAAGAPILGTLSLSSNNTILTFRPGQHPALEHQLHIQRRHRDHRYQRAASFGACRFALRRPQHLEPGAARRGNISATIPAPMARRRLRRRRHRRSAQRDHDLQRDDRHDDAGAGDGERGLLGHAERGVFDKLRLLITERTAARRRQDLPRFTKVNGDGSVSVVIGADGGRVEGAGGTAVDIPAAAFPQGAVVTIRPVPAADFPSR